MNKIFVIILLLVYPLVLFADYPNIEDNRKQFSLNIGTGYSFTGKRSPIDNGSSFHFGADYFILDGWGTVGLRYSRLSYYNYENKKNDNSDLGMQNDNNGNCFHLFIRLPLKNVTLALGPAVIDSYGETYFNIAGTLGMATDMDETVGFEFGVTFYYPFESIEKYYYFFLGLRVNL